MRQRRLYVERLGRGFAWFDAGTHDSLLEAAEFVRVLQRRQGQLVCAPDEIAFHNGWIDADSSGSSPRGPARPSTPGVSSTICADSGRIGHRATSLKNPDIDNASPKSGFAIGRDNIPTSAGNRSLKPSGSMPARHRWNRRATRATSARSCRRTIRGGQVSVRRARLRCSMIERVGSMPPGKDVALDEVGPFAVRGKTAFGDGDGLE